MPKSAIALFFICLVIYHLNGRAHAEVDCVAAPFTAWSLVKHGNLDLREYPELHHHLGTCIREMPDGSHLSMRPPGSALAALPVIAPLALFRDTPPRAASMLQLGKLSAALSVAASAVVFYLLCLHLAPVAAVPATVLFALGTCMWSVASQALWMHGPAAFWITLALYWLCGPRTGDGIWSGGAGLALGLAALTRPTTALFGLASAIVLAAQRRWRAAAWLCLGGAIPAIILVVLNWATFGDPLLGGYSDDKWGESPPLWLGLGGLLIAPSRGVLVYSPALLLTIPVIIGLVRRQDSSPANVRGMLIGWLVATGLTVLFYARWYDWRGGFCYGPRFLCETMPLLCMVFALAYQRLQSAAVRFAANGLIALSVAVHVVGVFGYSGYVEWQLRHNLPDQGRCLFELRDTQIEAHAREVIEQVIQMCQGKRRVVLPPEQAGEESDHR
jgi:hypothetical protein